MASWKTVGGKWHVSLLVDLAFFCLSQKFFHCSKGRFSRILNVQKSILVLLFLVDGRHQSRVGRNRIRTKQKEGLFGRQLDALSNDVMKLPHGQVCRYQIFFLVDIGNVGSIGLFAYHRNSVGVLGADAFCFRLALFCRVCCRKRIAKNSNKGETNFVRIIVHNNLHVHLDVSTSTGHGLQ